MAKKINRANLASELINCVPTNWCDSLLTGDNKVLPDGHAYNPKDIERLLLAIRERMEKLAMEKV